MVIDSVQESVLFFSAKLDQTSVEEFWIAALDSQKNCISSALLFKGTINYCLFHPRDIFRFIIIQNAVSFIVAHNHPSGCPNPSREDIQITRTLMELSHLFQIGLEDHLIISNNSYFSFRQNWKKIPEFRKNSKFKCWD